MASQRPACRTADPELYYPHPPAAPNKLARALLSSALCSFPSTMVSHKALAAAAVAFFLSPPALAAMYPKNSPVLQVGAKDYDKLIAKSNHTSVSFTCTLAA